MRAAPIGLRIDWGLRLVTRYVQRYLVLLTPCMPVHRPVAPPAPARSLLDYFVGEFSSNKPVAPRPSPARSLLENWERELETWCPGLRVIPYYGKSRGYVREQMEKYRKRVEDARA